METNARAYLRIMGWWLLVQSWGTLRFDDHRGLLPADVVVNQSGMLAKLSRTKVSGPDKNVSYKVVVVDAAAYLRHKDWVQTGWSILCQTAPFERDYLLPSPMNILRGCKCAELQYHTAFALQSQVIACSLYQGQRIFRTWTQHYFTPHSGRNFLPSAAAVLNFSKTERDVLGGWSSEGSERYARVARHRISTVQRAVASALNQSDKRTIFCSCKECRRTRGTRL